MNRFITTALILLGASATPVTGFANTAEFDGDSSYEWHLGPPTLYISGDSASKLMTDMKFSNKGKKVTVTVDCEDFPGTTAPAVCTLEFKNP